MQDNIKYSINKHLKKCEALINNYALKNNLYYFDICNIGVDIFNGDVHMSNINTCYDKHNKTLYKELYYTVSYYIGDIEAENYICHLVGAYPIEKTNYSFKYNSIACYIISHMIPTLYKKHMSFSEWKSFYPYSNE